MQTILVVDDDAANRYLLECMLRGHGYEVVSASNGKDALEQAKRRPPDLVITDILMPIMDGFTLCRQLKQDDQLRRIPTVFYTATYTDSKDEQFALSLGADLFVLKPADPDSLLAELRGLLERPRPEAECHPVAGSSEDAPYLMQYSQVLVRKLEQKVLELEEANRRLVLRDRALATSLSGVVFAELSGTITYVNAAFCRVWGYPEHECLRLRLAELFSDQAMGERMARKLTEVGGFCGEIEAKQKDGSTFWAQIVAHVVCDALYKPVCIMLSCNDVTEHKRLQEAVQRSARLESLSLFAAGTAHDFNNLLTGLLGSMELAYDADSTAESRAAQYPMVRAAFDRARDLSRRLMTFAKGSPAKRRLLRIPELVEECCSLALTGTRTRCNIQTEPSLWQTEGDATQLSQVLDNVVINARQAMSDGGTVWVSAQNISNPGAKAPLPPGDYVRIRIRDEGPGIPEDILPKVCDPFFTTKPNGNGLGLPSSYAIVRDHGGHLGITSTVGVGTTVEIWLIAKQAERPERALEAAPAVVRGAGRILVMDDDDTIRDLTRRQLSGSGYDVSVAANGETAVALYEEALAKGRPFGLVLLDLTVREGLGGVDALHRLRGIDPHVVAVATSAISDDATAGRVRDAGFASVLSKPFMSHELFSIVKGAFRVDPENWSDWLEPPSTQRSR